MAVNDMYISIVNNILEQCKKDYIDEENLISDLDVINTKVIEIKKEIEKFNIEIG